MIGNLVIFDISIFEKGIPFFPSWLEKEKLSSWLGKKEHIFAQFECSKTIILLLLILIMLF